MKNENNSFAKELLNVPIENEMRQSYLDYAMSVIIGRALPSVQDGLKPVHRRVLFAMQQLHNDYNKPYKKSARVVGDVIGKYHPHGDAAIYESIVRMAQPFSLRYMLVDGQGNFGSVDGDAPAAMRYTEVRLAKIAHELLADLEKETVDFVPNYDGTELMPAVLPTKVPNLLVNGSSGIAVGMATNIPPHNLGEVIAATLALLDNPDLSLAELMQYLPGPDFPTAGIINGSQGIVEAYKTGRGKIYLRAKTEIETKPSGKQAIIITELPFQVNKARLQEKIGELVRDKRLDGIVAIRDESDKKGMRVVIELRRGENAEVMLNNLFSLTQLQVVFGINMVALEGGQPKIMNLKEILWAFLQHRTEVVTRRTNYDLRKARERAHLLEGLGIALVNIDEVVALIKAAATPKDAKANLTARVWQTGAIAAMLQKIGKEFTEYKLSEEQAQAILDMKLHRLTGLEQEKIMQEFRDLLYKIEELTDILANPELLKNVIRQELIDLNKQYGDIRRTKIVTAQEELVTEDLIAAEEVVVTLSRQGYVKMQPVSTYQAQHRGGRGKSATKVKEEDFVAHLAIANTHDTILCFSNKGKLYWLRCYLLPQGGRSARGKPIVNLLPLASEESISAILPIKEFVADEYVFMATAQGIVKKVALSDFSRPRTGGIIAVDLQAGDHLIGANLTKGKQDIMLFTDAGKAIRFHEQQVRVMGRNARGVRGIKLQKGQYVISLVVVKDNIAILTATENGYGKRTALEDYSVINRSGSGVIAIKVSKRNGKVIGAVQVQTEEEIMLLTDQGTLIRMPVAEISIIGRNTQGVRLINLVEGEKLMALKQLRVADVY